MQVELTVNELIEKSEAVTEALEKADASELDRDNWEDELGEFLERIEDLKDTEPKLYRAIYEASSGKGVIRKYLKDNKGEVVSSDHLNRISGIQEHARRVRELRVEEGFEIDSTRTRSELDQGEYILREIKDDFDEKSRIKVGKRNKQIKEQPSCELCGRHRDHEDVKYIEVDHIEEFVDYDDPDAVNDLDNLRTLCNDCHHGKHAVDGTSNRR